MATDRGVKFNFSRVWEVAGTIEWLMKNLAGQERERFHAEMQQAITEEQKCSGYLMTWYYDEESEYNCFHFVSRIEELVNRTRQSMSIHAVLV